MYALYRVNGWSNFLLLQLLLELMQCKRCKEEVEGSPGGNNWNFTVEPNERCGNPSVF